MAEIYSITGLVGGEKDAHRHHPDHAWESGVLNQRRGPSHPGGKRRILRDALTIVTDGPHYGDSFPTDDKKEVSQP